MEKTCSLWIMVARTDVSFMMQTIPHIVHMCKYPFREKILAIDESTLSGDKRFRSYIGSIELLRENCRRLLVSGIIDRVVDIDTTDGYKRKVYQKHFNSGNLKNTHNYKGYPVLGSIYCLEECRDDYILHFDSDMLVFQEKDFDWIGSGMRLMEESSDILWVRPSSGPQDEEHNYYAGMQKIIKDDCGFYLLNEFSSRCYLLSKRKFNTILPLKILWAKRQGRFKDKCPRTLIEIVCSLSGRGILDSWEKMVTGGMNGKKLMGAHIADKAWTLHPKDHNDIFLSRISGIIRNVEKGWYPDGQAGFGDIHLERWMQ